MGPVLLHLLGVGSGQGNLWGARDSPRTRGVGQRGCARGLGTAAGVAVGGGGGRWHRAGQAPGVAVLSTREAKGWG